MDMLEELTYIYGQSNKPIDSIPLGKYTVGYAGCGPIAVHNTLCYLDVQTDFQEVIEYFEDNRGLVLGGLVGTRSKICAKYLKSKDIEIDYIRHAWRYQKKLDEVVKSKRGVIVQYAGFSPIERLEDEHEGEGSSINTSFRIGGHYIATRYNEVDDNFIMYNAYSNDTSERMTDSVRDHINSMYRFVFDMSYILII